MGGRAITSASLLDNRWLYVAPGGSVRGREGVDFVVSEDGVMACVSANDEDTDSDTSERGSTSQSTPLATTSGWEVSQSGFGVSQENLLSPPAPLQTSYSLPLVATRHATESVSSHGYAQAYAASADSTCTTSDDVVFLETRKAVKPPPVRVFDLWRAAAVLPAGVHQPRADSPGPPSVRTLALRRPAEAPPADRVALTVATLPADAHPVEAIAADSHPPEAHPVDDQPADAHPVGAHPAGAHPADELPAGTHLPELILPARILSELLLSICQ